MSNETEILPDKSQMNIRNNLKKVWVKIIALVALSIFSFETLQLTSSPGSCSSCHQIYASFESWSRSVHSGVTCRSCHTPPGIVETARRIYVQFSVYNRPNNNNRPKIYVKDNRLVGKACGRCHSSNRTMAFSGGLAVPHENHLERGFSCTICHSKVVHGEGGEKTRKPEMETCMQCHNGKMAPEGCGICHLTLPEIINDDYDPANDR